MIKVVVLCLCLATALALNSDGKNSRIVGGVDALAGEYPYIVSIQRLFLTISTHVCGGTILNNFHVLTAAQCFFGKSAGRHRVQAGKLNLNQFEPVEQTVNMLWFTMHPNYDGSPTPYDLAIVRLQSPFGFNSFIQPVVMPIPNSIPSGVVRFAGWGSTSMGLLPGTPTILQQTRVSVFPNENCTQMLYGVMPITPENVCLGPATGGIGACNGDAGGPVVQVTNGQHVLVGIITWQVFPCGIPGVPSISSRVSAFNDWIQENS
ncbi:trypsin-1-like [Ochlerotatus camptorhynchus]|uniref:trypsin-1-like n=1 Tax=Ochlerotatus camptorhynchus TaxID=644619 RepID=UPI0031D65949